MRRKLIEPLVRGKSEANRAEAGPLLKLGRNIVQEDLGHTRAIDTPLAPVALIFAIVAIHLIKNGWSKDTVVAALALHLPIDGHSSWRLVSSLFVHVNWMHVLMNGGFILAFGAQVARTMGSSARGAAVFLLYFVTCGAAATGFWLIFHGDDVGAIYGASGAAAALMGGTSRLLEIDGDVARVFSTDVLKLGVPWVILNLAFGATDAGLIPFIPSANMAWEAHIAGFVLGVVLLPAFLKLSGFKGPPPRD